MTTSGPGPRGPGPDASVDLAVARRRVFGPGDPGPDDVAEYERLQAIATQQHAAVPALRPEEEDAAPVAEHEGEVASTRSPRRRRGLVVVAGGLAAVLLLMAAIVTTRPSLPQQVDVPALAGTTLLAYGRLLDPSTGPGSISYQPEGYTVFQPRDRTVAVALRCIGRGTVHISAGQQFDFRCADRERTTVQRDSGPRSGPFIVMGTTVGDVVWSARIVLIDPPQTAGAIPGFRDSCASCTTVGQG